MSVFLLFIFILVIIIIIFVVNTVITFISKVVNFFRILFGRGKTSHKQKAKTKNTTKIFAKYEGEYVDFEEIKECS